MCKAKQELVVILFGFFLFIVLINMDYISLFFNNINYSQILISMDIPEWNGMPAHEETLLTLGQLMSFASICLFTCSPFFFFIGIFKLISKLPVCEEN